MAICAACGAEVRWVEYDGEQIPLDAHEVMRGPGRFAETEEGLVAVSETAEVLAVQDHRVVCAARRQRR